ncbi:MAG TPA: DoxX family protein [Alphaproteobacteria bacterium]|nr:DoxX family protein [Alphaproteobacteria bacterium]
MDGRFCVADSSLCVAALFIPDGFGKLMNFSRFTASLAQHQLPFPELWAAAGIVIALGGGIAVLLGIQVRWAARLLLAFVIIATALSHRYREIAEEVRRRRTPASSGRTSR